MADKLKINCFSTLAWSNLALPLTEVACAYLHFLMDWNILFSSEFYSRSQEIVNYGYS